MTEDRNKGCKACVEEAAEGRLKDIRKMYEAEDQTDAELGALDEYGLCLDYVEPGTFKGQRAGYYRYQLSYGGPSEEFRVYLNGDVEFWFLDWFDGASVEITGNDADMIRDIVSVIEGTKTSDGEEVPRIRNGGDRGEETEEVEA